MEDGLVIQILGRHNRLDDVLHEVLVDLVVGDVWGVLRGDQDGVHPLRDHGSVFLLVLDCDLRLPVWPQPRNRAILPGLHIRSAVCEKGEFSRYSVEMNLMTSVCSNASSSKPQ